MCAEGEEVGADGLCTLIPCLAGEVRDEAGECVPSELARYQLCESQDGEGIYYDLLEVADGELTGIVLATRITAEEVQDYVPASVNVPIQGALCGTPEEPCPAGEVLYDDGTCGLPEPVVPPDPGVPPGPGAPVPVDGGVPLPGGGGGDGTVPVGGGGGLPGGGGVFPGGGGTPGTVPLVGGPGAGPVPVSGPGGFSAGPGVLRVPGAGPQKTLGPTPISPVPGRFSTSSAPPRAPEQPSLQPKQFFGCPTLPMPTQAWMQTTVPLRMS